MSKYAKTLSEEFKAMRDRCPNVAAHNEPPLSDNYHAVAEWAERMLKTHTQSRCPGCGFYVIWTPKS